MDLQQEIFEKKIVELRRVVSDALSGETADERLFVLRDLLLSQLDVCALHYRLMQIEAGERYLFAEAPFSDMVSKHLELLKLFRDLRKPGEKSSYETESMSSFYWFIAAHFREDEH